MSRDEHSETMRRVCKKLDDVLEWINGKDGHPGAKVQIDRLEQSNVRRVWWVRSSMVAAFTALAGFIHQAWQN